MALADAVLAERLVGALAGERAQRAVGAGVARRWMRKSAKRANTPSSAPSGQSARQNRRGIQRLASRIASSSAPASQPPGHRPAAGQHGQTAGSSPRPRASSDSGSSRPLCRVPTSAPAEHGGEQEYFSAYQRR